MALILTGNLAIDATDVSSFVRGFILRGTRELIEIPATLGADKSFSPGDDEYEIEIEFLQGVNTAGADLTITFDDLLADATGTFAFTGNLQTGATSATNPEYSGTAVVTSSGDIGGTVNTVGLATVTFPLTGRWTRSNT